MADKPVTREEKYLAYLTGDYKGELPKPITRKEKYLYELCLKGMGGEISPEEIKNAVNEYLEKNPVKPGATTEQAQQIEQNKTDVASLKEETSSLKEDLVDIVNQTMNVAKSKNLISLPDGEYINAESQKRIKANVKNNIVSITSLISSPPFGSRIFIPFSIEKDIKTTLQIFCDYKANNNFFISIYDKGKEKQLVAVSATNNYVKSSTANISKGDYF